MVALVAGRKVPPRPRFQLGDRVLVEPNDTQGIIVGVRYGEIAYDVLCGGEYLRDLSPKLIRPATT